jgi:hypothetical protein
MEYIVLIRIDGDWREVTRIEAADQADAIRKGENAMPPEFKGRAMGLKSVGSVARESDVKPQRYEPDETASKPL